MIDMFMMKICGNLIMQLELLKKGSTASNFNFPKSESKFSYYTTYVKVTSINSKNGGVENYLRVLFRLLALIHGHVR